MMLTPRLARKKRQDRLGKALVVGTLLFAMGIVAVYFFVLAGRPKLDPVSMCRKDSRPPSIWAFVIDATDQFNAIQRAWIASAFESVSDDVPLHGMLAVYQITASGEDAMRPLLALCNPGRGDTLSALWANPELVRRRWETAFRGPLDSLLRQVALGPGAKVSPIMQSLQALNVTAPFGSGRDQSTARRIWIVSDMLQHGNRYSHYRAAPPRFEDFEESEMARQVYTDLTGVEVEIFYVGREPHAGGSIQGRTHIEFWNKWFGSLGATVVRALRVEG